MNLLEQSNKIKNVLAEYLCISGIDTLILEYADLYVEYNTKITIIKDNTTIDISNFDEFYNIIEEAKQKNIKLAENFIEPHFDKFKQKFNNISLIESIEDFVEIFIEEREKITIHLKKIDNLVAEKYLDILNLEFKDLKKKEEQIKQLNEEHQQYINKLIDEYNIDQNIMYYFKLWLNNFFAEENIELNKTVLFFNNLNEKVYNYLNKCNFCTWTDNKVIYEENKIMKDYNIEMKTQCNKNNIEIDSCAEIIRKIITKDLEIIYSSLNRVYHLNVKNEIVHSKRMIYNIDNMIETKSKYFDNECYNDIFRDIYFDNLNIKLTEIPFLSNIDFEKNYRIDFVTFWMEYSENEYIHMCVTESFYNKILKTAINNFKSKSKYINILNNNNDNVCINNIYYKCCENNKSNLSHLCNEQTNIKNRMRTFLADNFINEIMNMCSEQKIEMFPHRIIIYKGADEFFLNIMREYNYKIKYIPNKIKTQLFYEYVAKKFPGLLIDVENRFKTNEIYELAAQNNGSLALRSIHDDLKTPKMCELAIKNNGSLGYVPNKLRTIELCELAIKNNGSLRDVPEEIKTQDLCELAIKKVPYNIMSTPYMYKTKELCEITIKNNPNLLEYIPKEHKTKEMCEISVKSNGNNLEFVPYMLKTVELCKIAVKNIGTSLKFIPIHIKTKETCELAVLNDSIALEYVPKKLKTKELCDIAWRSYKYNGDCILKYIPNKFKTKRMCERTIKNEQHYTYKLCTNMLKYVPIKLKTKELCELAIKQNGLALEDVPDEFKTIDFFELAIKQNGNALKYVPEDLKTLELCKLAIIFKSREFSNDSLSYVPNKFKILELYVLYAKQNRYKVSLIPNEIKTLEFWELVKTK